MQKRNKHTNWKEFLFGDEVSIELFKMYRERVWKKKGEDLRVGLFRPCNKFFSKQYVKFFAYFSYKGVGELRPVETRRSKRTFINLLNNINTNGRRLAGANFKLFLDRDSVHKSRVVVNFLEGRRILSPPNSAVSKQFKI